MIEFQAISKSFAGVPVLRHASFQAPPGRTVGLVGENGAGKSTLMNILGGNLRPDSGRMLLNRQPYSPRSPLDAARLGIAFIHQELNLFPNLSIAENIFLTAFPLQAGCRIDRQRLRDRTRSLLAQVGLDLPPDTPVERLSAGERQLVEIAKALSFDARLVIFDEPTTSLSAREAESLFSLMSGLRARGLSLIFISHALNDVLRLCDDIVVLRDGEVVGAGPRGEFTQDRLISLMVGRSLSQLYPTRTGGPAAQPVLEVAHLCQPGIVHDITFSLFKGEVLGLSGLMGAGRSELARILFGLDAFSSGRVSLKGAALRQNSSRSRIRRGLAFLTENRREEGLCLEASIADNMALVALRQFARGPARNIDAPSLQRALKSMRDAVRLTPGAKDRQAVKTLSGGNQQKVVLAKWLLAKPQVLILDEPTRGIDVGAKFEIYQLIHQLADGGAGVLVISSDLEELIGLCDRILVMCRGEICDELQRSEFDRERIMRAALRSGEVDAPAAAPHP
jgi:ribose transport system ATP-binding protein